MMNRPQRLLFDPLYAAAAADPMKAAVIVDGTRHRYRELLDSALRLARAFREYGLRRGDRVAIYLENSWPSVVSIYATWLAGGVIVVVNPQTKPEKLAYLLEDSEATILVSDPVLLMAARRGLGRVLPVDVVISTGPVSGDLAGALDFEHLADGPAAVAWEPGVIPLDLAALIYTSGSTGFPKGVMMTHQSMLFAAGSIAEYLRLGARDRILNVLPLAFDYGLYQLLMSVHVRATLVLERSFAYPVQVVERVRGEQVTVFPGVPTIFAMLLSLQERVDVRMPTVTRVTNTAAALPVDHIPRLRNVFPTASIYSMYGLTECKRVSYLEPKHLSERPASVGKAIPGTEVFLLSPEGEPVAPGEPGILHVRGPHVMLGYWKQPEMSQKMLKPGRYPGERVLCTHDYFRMDEDGFLYFVGRTDDVIKTRGEKVSPLEVENVLHSIDGVREAAVIGVPDELLGQAIRAFVVLAEGATLTEREIKRRCREKLEAFMVPQEIIFLDALPMTETAKVRKESLRWVEAERREKVPV